MAEMTGFADMTGAVYPRWNELATLTWEDAINEFSIG